MSLRSWNYDDNPRQCQGYIKINNVVRKEFKLSSINRTAKQGLYILPILPWTENSTEENVRRFDTERSKESSKRLQEFLTDLPKGSVIIGASAGDISRYFPYVREQLEEFGIYTGEATTRLSIAFTGVKGYPEFAKYSMAAKGDQGPITLKCDMYSK